MLYTKYDVPEQKSQTVGRSRDEPIDVDAPQIHPHEDDDRSLERFACCDRHTDCRP